jgi:hypothetical protein
MYFEELSIEEKVAATLSYFKSKNEARVKGQNEADRHIKENACKIKKNLKGEKKVSLKC